VFFPSLKKRFPHLLKRYQERYKRDAYLKQPYKEIVRERVAAIREKYDFKSGPQSREFPWLKIGEAANFKPELILKATLRDLAPRKK
jgi:hypothetical protein